jgi:peroxiredoxin
VNVNDGKALNCGMSYLSFIGAAAIAVSAAATTISTTDRPPTLSGQTASYSDSSYTLTGKIDGMDAGWVYLVHRQMEGSRVDSVQVDKRGQFMFTGHADTPEFCLLGIYNRTGGKEFHISFFLENGTIILTGNRDSMQNAVVAGTPVQDEYRQYLAAVGSAVDWASYRNAYRAAEAKKDKHRLDSLEAAAGKLTQQEQQFAANYTRAHPGSYVSVFELYSNFSYNPDVAELQGLYNGLDISLRRSYFGQRLNETIAAALKTDIGKPAPDFTQADIHGKPVALSSFKGHYVLVDFWASWCGPCRAENPAVVKAYKKYHARGFSILGVSLDEKKDKWQEAIKKDGLDWMQVSDLKGWQNSVAELYGVKGIPMNYLLDQDGKIIAKGLRGEELEKKLAELVH